MNTNNLLEKDNRVSDNVVGCIETTEREAREYSKDFSLFNLLNYVIKEIKLDWVIMHKCNDIPYVIIPSDIEGIEDSFDLVRFFFDSIFKFHMNNNTSLFGNYYEECISATSFNTYRDGLESLDTYTDLNYVLISNKGYYVFDSLNNAPDFCFNPANEISVQGCEKVLANLITRVEIIRSCTLLSHMAYSVSLFCDKENKILPKYILINEHLGDLKHINRYLNNMKEYPDLTIYLASEFYNSRKKDIVIDETGYSLSFIHGTISSVSDKCMFKDYISERTIKELCKNLNVVRTGFNRQYIKDLCDKNVDEFARFMNQPIE